MFTKVIKPALACRLTGLTCGERSTLIAHILGHCGTNTACPYMTKEAITEAKAHQDETSLMMVLLK
jgi:hypothetical protein